MIIPAARRPIHELSMHPSPTHTQSHSRCHLPVDQEPPEPGNEHWDELFADLDMNHDGTLTKNEILKRLKTADDRLLKRFSSVLQLPQNLKRLDGSLNKFENMWKKMDVDDDKEVTLTEFRAYCSKFQKVRNATHGCCSLAS